MKKNKLLAYVTEKSCQDLASVKAGLGGRLNKNVMRIPSQFLVLKSLVLSLAPCGNKMAICKIIFPSQIQFNKTFFF